MEAAFNELMENETKESLANMVLKYMRQDTPTPKKFDAYVDAIIAVTDKHMAEKKPDLVNHPPHYTFGRFEVIEVLEDWFPDDPLLWQVVKYLARAKHKGNFTQDLEKAQFYLNRKIEGEKK